MSGSGTSWKRLPADAAALDAKLTAKGPPVSPGAADEGTTDSYTPKASHIDKYLVAQAAYMDRTEDTDNDFTAASLPIRAGFIRFDNLATSLVTARVVDDPANAAPMFVEGSTATRYVEEDAEHDGPIDPERGRRTRASEPIGAELEITDADGGGDSHTWALGGPDAASFDIDAANGQLMTRGGAGLREQEHLHRGRHGAGRVRQAQRHRPYHRHHRGERPGREAGK